MYLGKFKVRQVDVSGVKEEKVEKLNQASPGFGHQRSIRAKVGTCVGSEPIRPGLDN